VSASSQPVSRSALFPGIGIAAFALLVLFLALPILGLLLRVPPSTLVAHLASPTVRDALRLSLVTSLVATTIVVLLGLPAAWLLTTRSFPGKRLLEVLVDLPMVLPPTVAGIALLLAFGRMGLAGRSLDLVGITLPFTTAAVVMAQVFMAAPFFIAAARAGFSAVDPRLLEAAATLRASEARRFRRVVLPLAMPSLIAGAAMTAARALGEFGATITFAGNLPGVTQTMPLAVYLSLQSDLDAAVALALLLLAWSFALLLALRSAPAFRMGGGDAGRPRATLTR
jgi:molybdate transport system permease protein